ncbi:MAG: phosphoglucomutase/phosphomannomutase family protein, partial [Planctomycetota bacterium]
VTQAIADYLKAGPKAKGAGHKVKSKTLKVVVGYDTRFLSKEFAASCAEVLAANRINVLLSGRDVPTPVISYQIIKTKADGGINFTASHNPPQYNGIKFSPDTGAPAPPEITKEIERRIEKLRKEKSRKLASSSSARTKKKDFSRYIKVFDPKPAYFSQIKKKIRFDLIKKANLKIAVDCLYGTAREYLDRLLKENGCKTEVLHNWLNPSFEGRRPEPAKENIQELIGIVRKKRFNLGLACDGDADRFGIVDSDGSVISANQVISLLLYHLAKTRPLKKNAVCARTVATTNMIDSIADKFGIKVYETGVGFKYFEPYLNRDNCIIAGEESGGLSISGHVPEKDGILACLLIAEMVAINKKPLKQILKQLYSEAGWFYSERIDLNLPQQQKDALITKLNNATPKSFAGGNVFRANKKDGCKLLFSDGSWVLFRPSGTEPVIRCYFEARSPKRLKALMRAGRKLVAPPPLRT